MQVGHKTHLALYNYLKGGCGKEVKTEGTEGSASSTK